MSYLMTVTTQTAGYSIRKYGFDVEYTHSLIDTKITAGEKFSK